MNVILLQVIVFFSKRTVGGSCLDAMGPAVCSSTRSILAVVWSQAVTNFRLCDQYRRSEFASGNEVRQRTKPKGMGDEAQKLGR